MVFTRAISRLCIAIVVLGCATLSPAEPAIYVEPDHPVYEFIERLSAKRLVELHVLAIRPKTRHEIATILSDIPRKSTRLTEQDRRRLRFYLGEFADELPSNHPARESDAAWWTLRATEQEKTHDYGLPWWRNLLRKRTLGVDNDVTLRPLVSLGADIGQDTAMTWSRKIRVGGWATFGSSWSAQAMMVEDVEFGDGAAPPPRFGPERGVAFIDGTLGSSFSVDDPQALVTYSGRHATLSGGVFPLEIGHGRHANTILSDKAPPLPHVQLTVHPTPALTFTYLHMFLQSGVPDTTSPWYTESDGWQSRHLRKYFVLHRLDYAGRGFEIGLGESVIYGARNLEPIYLIPVVPFRAAQHDVGDLDNLQMFVDGALTAIPYTRVYGSFFIDEMAFEALTSRVMSHSWWAWQIGLLTTDVLGLIPNVDLRAEYTGALPWAYHHRYPWNTYDTYAYHGNDPVVAYPLGFFNGHNSDYARFDIQWRPVWNVELTGSASLSRRGSEGSIVEQYDTDAPAKEFLFGDVTRTYEYRFGVRWEFARDFFASGMVSQTTRKTEDAGVTSARDWTTFSLGVTYRIW